MKSSTLGADDIDGGAGGTDVEVEGDGVTREEEGVPEDPAVRSENDDFTRDVLRHTQSEEIDGRS